MEIKPTNIKQLSKLVEDLKSLNIEPPKFDLDGLIEQLKARATTIRNSFQSSFAEQLRKACVAEQLPQKQLQDDFAIGPFQLRLNLSKEEASLSYAKAIVEQGIPLDAAAIVAEAKKLKSEILDQPVDSNKIRQDLDEAARVAYARKNKPLKGELRIELPAIFRELAFIRQNEGGNVKRTVNSFNLARFVVELTKVVRSDENLSSKRQFALETAVIENTKDSRRSIYFPKDLSQGYGEGTYYQALLLKGE